MNMGPDFGLIDNILIYQLLYIGNFILQALPLLIKMKIIRIHYRLYLVLLCLAYFTMLYIFHGNLQVEINTKWDKQLPTSSFANDFESFFGEKVESRKIRVLQTKNFTVKRNPLYTPKVTLLKLEVKATELHGDHVRVAKSILQTKSNLTSLNNSFAHFVEKDHQPRTCYLEATVPNRQFYSLEPDSFIYSAYYDERYPKRYVRIMAVLSLNKSRRKLKVFCHFTTNGTEFKQEAIFYELCENHGKPFGGFILSCEVPREVTKVCLVTVSMEIVSINSKYIPPSTTMHTLQVTRLTPQDYTQQQTYNNVSKQFNFTVCIPPLFGDIASEKLIEFIELNRLLGFQHFIFYTAKLNSEDTLKVLDYYKTMNVVTVIDFNLPSVIQKSKIWYNGQLSAHNDCLYRAMSITNFVALIDIDEFIVPHNGQFTVSESILSAFRSPDTCGLSFESAFYDSKFSKQNSEEESPLITQFSTGRSSLFSKIRTKVVVQPEKIFEVGIHHISKPAQETFKVIKVNTTNAYLHHYRSCVPNYGMKCNQFQEDLTMLKYSSMLKNAVHKAKSGIFVKDSEL